MDQTNRNRQNQNYKDNNIAPEEKQFEENVVNIDRVSRVVKGGRRFRFRALVVIGDKKGQVGIGVSKGQDVQVAVQKATDVAKKNLVKVALNNQTIPHDVEAKVAGAKIWLKPAAAGTGLKAGGVVRTVLEAAGVQNILSKSLGSSNKINCAYATVEALKQLSDPSSWITAKVESAKVESKKSVKATVK